LKLKKYPLVVSRDFRLNTRVDAFLVSNPGIKPREHRFKYMFWKFKNRKELTEEFKAAIKNPALRCVDCGCKYNFQISIKCPKCNSEKSYNLDLEDPFTDPAIRVVVGLITIAVVATKPLWHDLFF